MKRKAVRILALLLTLVMLVSAVPVYAFAQDKNIEETQPTEDNVQISAENDFSKIIMKAVEKQNEEISNPNNYGISDVKLTGTTAKVTFSAPENSKIVLAIYSEKEQMLDSAIYDCDGEAQSADISFGNIMTLPENYIIKGFILDQNNASLCKMYVDNSHTSVFKEFLAKTTDDFDKDLVINYDDSKVNNFAVFNDNMVKVYSDSKKNTLKSYDESRDVYVITNAEPAVKNLKKDDVLYLITGSGVNDYCIIEVGSVSVSGSTVTINSVEETMADVFSYIKIDTSGGLSQDEVSQVKLGEALTLVQPARTRSDGESYEGEGSTEIKTEIEYETTKEDSAIKVKIKGSLSLKLTVGIRVYYDFKLFGEDWFEYRFSHKEELTLKGSVTGKLAVDKEKVSIETPEFWVGPVALSAKLYPVIELSASCSFTIKAVSSFLQTYNPTDGEKRVQEKDREIDVDVKTKVEIKVGIGVSFEVKFVVLALEIGAEIGLKYTGDVKGVLQTLLDDYHLCSFCIEGELCFYVEGSITLSIEITKKLKWSLLNASVGAELPIGTMHISIYNGKFEIGMGECQHKMYKVIFKTQQWENSKIVNVPGAAIALNGGYADNDGDGKLTDSTVVTDDNGKAEAYYFNGTYQASASKDGYKDSTANVLVDGEKTYVYCTLTANGEPDNPDDPDNPPGTPSDGTGSNDSVFTGSETTGTIINFGSYPQSKVTDSATLSKLNAATQKWYSYNYMSGAGTEWYDGSAQASDYMQYCDITAGKDKYRGVKFSTYRPYFTNYQSTTSTGNTFQDDNGYYINTTYWFKYEPLKWRVLDPSEGLVLCENIIDSQAYSNTINYYNNEYRNSTGAYASDYESSSIREWLNDEFYNTAFNSSQQSKIVKTHLENKSTKNSTYNSADTEDKVFLLSYYDVINTNYGFASSASARDVNRRAHSTDYAKCQGVYTYTGSYHQTADGEDTSYWWLRTPGYDSNYACDVYNIGDVNFSGGIVNYSHGIRPALRLAQSANPKSSAPVKKAPAKLAAAAEAETMYASYSSGIAGNDYILLNVTGYGEDFTLTSGNLLYIDQLTADSSGNINIKFTPKYNDPSSTTLLIGDFGSGTEAKILTVSQVKKYSVTWIIDGKQTVEYYAKGDPIYTPSAPSKDGYTFKGWTPSVPKSMPGADMTFTAVYEKNPTPQGRVHSVKIDDIKLNYKKSAALKPSVTADPGVAYTVKYESSNPKVAAVDSNGKVTATKRGSGSATITCTVTDQYGNVVKDTCNVSVKLSFGQWLIVIVLFGWIWY